METVQQRKHWLNALALMLVFPTAYFLIINVLKFEMGINGPYDSIAPFLESAGIKENLGWNINLLILFGPVFAALIAAWQTVHVNWQFSQEQLKFQLAITKKKFPLFILVLAGLVLASLSFYFILENIVIRK